MGLLNCSGAVEIPERADFIALGYTGCGNVSAFQMVADDSAENIASSGINSRVEWRSVCAKSSTAINQPCTNEFGSTSTFDSCTFDKNIVPSHCLQGGAGKIGKRYRADRKRYEGPSQICCLRAFLSETGYQTSEKRQINVGTCANPKEPFVPVDPGCVSNPDAVDQYVWCEPSEVNNPRNNNCETPITIFCITSQGTAVRSWDHKHEGPNLKSVISGKTIEDPCSQILNTTYRDNGIISLQTAIAANLAEQFYLVDGNDAKTTTEKDFQERINAWISTYPSTKADNVLDEACKTFSREELSLAFGVNDSFVAACGCHQPLSNYDATSALTGGRDRECDTLCNLPGVVPRNNAEPCTQSNCVIDGVTIEIINSSVGSINLTQICGDCATTEGGTCDCYFSEISVSVINSVIEGGINFTQACDACFIAPDGDLLNPTEVDCDDPEAILSAVNAVNSSSVGQELSKNRKTYLIITISIISVIILIIVITLIVKGSKNRRAIPKPPQLERIEPKDYQPSTTSLIDNPSEIKEINAY